MSEIRKDFIDVEARVGPKDETRRHGAAEHGVASGYAALTRPTGLKEDIVSYFLREVQPYVADAWIDRKVGDEQDGGIGKVGYEINFNREFFKYQPPRPLAEIDAELAAVESRIMGMLREVTE